MQPLGIDVGGSGIKGGIVDPARGELVGERHRIDTPEGFGFDDVTAAIHEVIAHFDHDGPVGIGFPAVVRRGIVASPPTAREVDGWVGRDLAGTLGASHEHHVAVANDADVAGLAEMRFGAGVGWDGVVLVLTLGTGVGSAMFNDGVLVPNTELGKLYLEGDSIVAENIMASRIRREEGLTYPEWAQRVARYLRHVDRLFSPDLVILGGGVSKRADKFMEYLDMRCPIRPATLRNTAGIVGASSLVADL